MGKCGTVWLHNENGAIFSRGPLLRRSLRSRPAGRARQAARGGPGVRVAAVVVGGGAGSHDGTSAPGHSRARRRLAGLGALALLKMFNCNYWLLSGLQLKNPVEVRVSNNTQEVCFSNYELICKNVFSKKCKHKCLKHGRFSKFRGISTSVHRDR